MAEEINHDLSEYVDVSEYFVVDRTTGLTTKFNSPCLECCSYDEIEKALGTPHEYDGKIYLVSRNSERVFYGYPMDGPFLDNQGLVRDR